MGVRINLDRKNPYCTYLDSTNLDCTYLESTNLDRNNMEQTKVDRKIMAYTHTPFIQIHYLEMCVVTFLCVYSVVKIHNNIIIYILYVYIPWYICVR